jgi:hypothetical protein
MKTEGVLVVDVLVSVVEGGREMQLEEVVAGTGRWKLEGVERSADKEKDETVVQTAVAEVEVAD